MALTKEEFEELAERAADRVKESVAGILSLFQREHDAKAEIKYLSQLPGLAHCTFWESIGDIVADVSPKTFKEVPPIMRTLNALGFRRVKNSWRTRVEATATPQWHYRKDKQDLVLIVNFAGNSGAGTCKFVTVGTKTQEVPIKQLVCDDGSSIAEAVALYESEDGGQNG